MKAKLIRLLVVFALFVGVIVAMALRAQNRNVTDLKVKIQDLDRQRFLNEKLVSDLVFPSGDFKSSKTNQLNISGMESSVLENPYVADAQIYLEPDGQLITEIEQEQPIFRIHSKKEKYYLTESLKKIPLSKRFSSSVLLVQGNIKESDFSGLKHLFSQINARKLLINQAIGVEKESENIFIIYLKNGTFKLELGDLKNLSKKFDNLEIFYEKYLPKVGLNYYSRIKLNIDNQIVAVKRK